MEFKNKKILVCGMARSGIAAAKILCELGAKVTATDLKNEIEIEKNFFSNEKFFCDEKKFSHEEKNFSDDEKNSNDKKNFSDDEKNFSNDKKNFSNDKKNFSNDKKNFSNDKKNFSDAEKFFFLDGKKIIFRLGEDPVNFFHEFEHIIISPGISINAPFVKKARATGIPVWGEAELAYNLCPCPIIAITGTNGKTTVTTLVGEILKKFFTQKNVVVAGNIGVPLTSLVTKLTREDIVVAEISSFQLETIEAFRPVISAVLNIAEDHIDRHLSMENYISAKSRIFENQGQNEISVLNYDDVITRKMNPRAKKIFFGANENLRDGIFIRDEKIFFNDAEIIPVNDTKVLPENALAATAITLAAGVSPQIIAEVLRAFKGVTHRLEFVATIEKVDYYNDSKATNTHAAIKALESFRRPVILIGGGSDKNTDFSPWTKLFYRKVARLLLIGQTADQIAKTCENEKFFAYEKLSSLEAAVLRAKEIAKPGDVVLFSPACASFDMFKNFEERGELFKFYVKGVI